MADLNSFKLFEGTGKSIQNFMFDFNEAGIELRKFFFFLNYVSESLI
jgi:hypothetical protein